MLSEQGGVVGGLEVGGVCDVGACMEIVVCMLWMFVFEGTHVSTGT